MVDHVRVFLAAICGAGFGAGVWLVVAWMRGVNILPNLDPSSESAEEQLKKVTGAIVAGGAVALITHWWVGGLIITIGIIMFWGRLGGGSEARIAAEKGEAIAAWTEMVYSVLQAGGGLEKAIATSARVAPDPIAREVQALAIRIELAPLGEAMAEFAHSVGHSAADKVAAAITLAAEHGSNDLSALLASQVESTRQEVRSLLEVEASRAGFRTSARMIVVITLIMASGMWLFSRGILSFYTSWFGQFVLAVVGAMFLFGFSLLTALSNSSEPERYFTGQFAEGLNR